MAWHRVKDSRNARVVERRPRGAPSSPFTLHKQLKHLVFGILSTVKSSPSMSHVSRLPVSKGRERRITMRTVRRDRYASRSPDIDYECRLIRRLIAALRHIVPRSNDAHFENRPSPLFHASSSLASPCVPSKYQSDALADRGRRAALGVASWRSIGISILRRSFLLT